MRTLTECKNDHLYETGDKYYTIDDGSIGWVRSIEMNPQVNNSDTWIFIEKADLPASA